MHSGTVMEIRAEWELGVKVYEGEEEEQANGER